MPIGNAGIGSAGLSPITGIGGAGISKIWTVPVIVTPGVPTIVGTEITFPATSDGTLVGAVYGVEFGVGVGAGYVWSENVAGAAVSQTITIDIATYGGTTSSTVNARIYYNLDVLDDPSTRVYSAMLAPIVVSASETGTTTEGETLTGANGIIVGGYPMTLTQQWRACDSGGANCSNIPSATNTTYVLTSGEVGDTIRYVKTATNTAGSGSATSNASAVVAAAAADVAFVAGNSLTEINAATLTQSITIASGTNLALAVIVLWSSGAARTVSSVVWNGSESLTAVSGSAVAASTADGLFSKAEIYVLKNPTATTANLVITMSAACRVFGGYIIASNVNATPTGTPSTNTSATEDLTPTTGAITGATGDLMIGGALVAVPSDQTITANSTQVWSAFINDITVAKGLGQRAAGASSVDLGWTQSGGNNSGFAATGVALKKA